MSGLTSRNKGKRGEREIIQLLKPIVDSVFCVHGGVPPLLQRNTLQSDKGGYDIVGLEQFAFEVKFQERENAKAWWEQTCRQAIPNNRIPVLFYRASRQAWKVRLWGEIPIDGVHVLPHCVDIDEATFLIWFEQKLNYLLTNPAR